VSTIAPELSGRWTKERRISVAWEMLAKIEPSCWVTQRIPFEQAAQAYRLLDESSGEAIQVLLTYNTSV
jgi:threonine dehydrogenase-like Zn-dependent dehydrogenase